MIQTVIKPNVTPTHVKPEGYAHYTMTHRQLSSVKNKAIIY